MIGRSCVFRLTIDSAAHDVATNTPTAAVAGEAGTGRRLRPAFSEHESKQMEKKGFHGSY